MPPLAQLVLLSVLTYTVVSMKYDGSPNSWLAYSRWDPCPIKDRAELKFKFSTEQQDGLLLYMDDGEHDYLMLFIEDGKLGIEYLFGTSEATDMPKPTRNQLPDKVNTGSDDEIPLRTVTVLRQRMRFRISLSGDSLSSSQLVNFGYDLCFGSCDQQKALENNSPMYFGGVPTGRRTLTTILLPNFVGDIVNVEYKNCNCFLQNPPIVQMGSTFRETPANLDACHNRTTAPECRCQLENNKCSCGVNCANPICGEVPPVTYTLELNSQQGNDIVNNPGLDAVVIGTPKFVKEPISHLKLGGHAYAQFAGPSQRDECLGNLDLCDKGYTISFWISIENANLELNNGILIANGAQDEANRHGIAIYWQNGKLITKFKKPNGQTWIKETDGLWPAQIYHDGDFVYYWYHYAATWSQALGLTVYLNGISDGELSQVTYGPRASESSTRNRISDSFLLLDQRKSNNISISEIIFEARHMQQNEIRERGPIMHIYMNMNEVRGNQLLAYPNNVQVNGDFSPMQVQGRADMALRLGRLSPDFETQFAGGSSYIDGGDMKDTCFGDVRKCSAGLYTSFWVKVDQQGTGVLLDTGPRGIRINHEVNSLDAYIYKSNRKSFKLSWNGIQPNQWYFVEVSYDKVEGMASMYINENMVARERDSRTDNEIEDDLYQFSNAQRSTAESSQLLIGNSNQNGQQPSGSFTIDSFEMLYGNRDLLLDIGYIQRGTPPHALYSMNDLIRDDSTGAQYVDYTSQSIQYDPRGRLFGDYTFVPGKDANAVYLPSQRSKFQIANEYRNRECYSNIEKCVHGLLVRGWFNFNELKENGGIMSTGVNGLDMRYKNGQLLVTADTEFRQWEAIAPVTSAEWQFIEASFHPKFGLTVYIDEEKIRSPTTQFTPKTNRGSSQSEFIIGGAGSNEAGTVNMPMKLDDLEIWYGDRDYLMSRCLLGPCDNLHYIIDFDERDMTNLGGKYLDHELLNIKYTGVLEPGYILNAMKVENGQNAEVESLKFTGTATRDHCLGNLTLCENGFTVLFYFNPKEGSLMGQNVVGSDNPDEQSGPRTYLLSTGLDGLDIFYKNGRIYAEARSNNKKWLVASEQGQKGLQENHYNKLIVGWSPTKGLLLARDSEDYVIDRDWNGMDVAPRGAGTSTYSKFMIGGTNRRREVTDQIVPPSANFDEMILYPQWFPPTLFEDINLESFSFERNLLPGVVEHPRFDVRLVGSASVMQTNDNMVGNGSMVDGNGAYIDLGYHEDSCLSDLEQCNLGATLLFKLKPSRTNYRERQVILSGPAFDVSIAEEKLVASFKGKDQTWTVRSYPLNFDEWQDVDLTWSDKGLQLFINGERQASTEQGERRPRTSIAGKMYVGRADSQAGRQYYNGEIDEIRIYDTTRDDLVKKKIIVDQCRFDNVKVDFTYIDSGSIIHEDRKIIVDGNLNIINAPEGDKLSMSAGSSISIGTAVTCQSRPNSCLNGLTMRFTVKFDSITRNSYVVSSNPIEIMFGSDGLLYLRYITKNGVWKVSLSGVEENIWYTFDMSWDNENGLTVYVNGEQRAWQQKANDQAERFDQSAKFMIGVPHFPTTFTQYSTLSVREIQVWDAKKELLEYCGLLPPLVNQKVRKMIYPPTDDGYVRMTYLPSIFNVTNDQWEEILIRFIATNGDGLIWYNENKGVKSYLYLEDGRLWLVVDDGTGSPDKTRISTTNFADFKEHDIKLRIENGGRIIFTIDGTELRATSTNRLIKIITEQFAIGGHRDVSSITNQVVTKSLRGNVTMVKISGNRYPNTTVDLFNQIWADQFPGYIRTSCNMMFEPPVNFLCDSAELPITFLANNTFITTEKWNMLGRTPSVKVKFTTVHPEGVLLFTGRKNGPYFALEMYDRKLWLVTDLGRGPVRKQVSGEDAADNFPHKAEFKFNVDDGKIEVSYDGMRKPKQDVSLNGILPSAVLFSGDMYLGGIPDYGRIPWYLLSRSGFIGCVEALQIDTVNSKLQDLVDAQNPLNVVKGCRRFIDYCDPNPCQNGGACHNSVFGAYCNCAGLRYGNYENSVCGELNLVGTINGTKYYDIELGRRIPTHNNDISAMFKTPASDGTIWMTDCPGTEDYLKVFLDDSVLKVEAKVDGSVSTTGLPGQYNDYEWHTVNVKRRANHLEFWVDNLQPGQIELGATNFYIDMCTIRLGANTPDAGNPPYFFGHVTNLIIDKVPPKDGEEPFILGERVIVMKPVTIKTPAAHVTISNRDDELKTNFKLVMNLKTKQKDALFFHQPGQPRTGEYLTGMLENGRPVFYLNFGGEHESIRLTNYIADNAWHEIELSRDDINTMKFKVDFGSPMTYQLNRPAQFDHDNKMYIGGIPGSLNLPEALRSEYKTGYRGCMSTVVKYRRLVNLHDFLGADVESSGNVVRGCQELPECVEKECMNGCKCHVDGSTCDSSMLPFRGPRCELPEVGFNFWENGFPGHILYRYMPPISTMTDTISFGFITCHKEGLLLKINAQNDREFIRIFLREGKVNVNYQLGDGALGRAESTQQYHNSRPYFLQFIRKGREGTLNILSQRGSIESIPVNIGGSGDTILNGLTTMEIGSELVNGEYKTDFRGTIYGVKHDRFNIFEIAQVLTSGQATVKQPGTRIVTGDPTEGFRCEITPLTGVCTASNNTCKNFGVCEDNKCNCTLTSYVGKICTEEAEGIYFGYGNYDQGVYVYLFNPPYTTDEDYLSLGFMTYEPNGTIFRVESVDGSQYYHVRLRDGYAELAYNLNGREEVRTEKYEPLHSYDDIYRVIRMNRTNTNITFYVDNQTMSWIDPNIAGVPFRNQKTMMVGGRFYRVDKTIVDDFNGIIAGVRYNGKQVIDYQTNSGGSFIIEGDTAIAPHPFKLNKPKKPVCDQCYNGGSRLSTDSNLCDCSMTAYGGVCCNELVGWGFLHKHFGDDTVIVYTNSSLGSSGNTDELVVGFRTAAGWPNGQILRIENTDGSQYIIVEIVDDQAVIRSRMGGSETNKMFDTFVRGQQNHVFKLIRIGQSGTVTLDQESHNFLFPSAQRFRASKIFVGGMTNGTNVFNGHYGMIWGLNYNGNDVIEHTRTSGTGVKLVAGGEGGFDLVELPGPVLCDKGSPDLRCNVAIKPTAGGGTGGVIPKIGPGLPVKETVGTGGGGGGGGVTTATGAIIGAAMGGLLLTSAIIWAASGMKPGFFTLGSRFAGGKGAGAGGKGAYVPVGDGGKPFPVSNGGNNYLTTVGMEEFGAGGGESQAGSRRSQYEESLTQESRFDAQDGMGVNGSAAGMGAGMAGGYNAQNTLNTTNSWYTRNETMENTTAYNGGHGVGGVEANGMGAGGMGAGGMGAGGMGAGGMSAGGMGTNSLGYGTGVRSGYAGSVTGGSVSGSVYGFGTVTNPDQAFITLSEDIAVDNVVLTADGRYVVTGSNLGPPQVWNTMNGEMVTTMRGDFMGSTGLHLAANEQYLVGETMAEQAAVDMNDIQTGNHIPIRRVAVWDFNTGNPLPIAVDQLCTASCVSKDGYKVIMAMTDKFGGGTTIRVLDLLSNKVLNELTYPDTIGVADSASCVFISPDDRFVAVGFTNSFDNNANFIIFDLHNQSGMVDSPIVALNADPHCTVILNHDEALTGTRNGELVIWSLKTGKAQRQLTSGDTTMLTQGGMPAAHDREVKEVSLSDDGRYLASASADRTVKVWNMDSESLMHTLHGHHDEVWTVDIASDNSIIVSGGQDGTIKLWRLRNGNQVTSFNATMDIFHARFSKDKKTVVALGDKYGARKLIMLQIVSQKKWRMKSSTSS